MQVEKNSMLHIYVD
jgi:hypothetical protein